MTWRVTVPWPEPAALPGPVIERSTVPSPDAVKNSIAGPLQLTDWVYDTRNGIVVGALVTGGAVAGGEVIGVVAGGEVAGGLVAGGAVTGGTVVTGAGAAVVVGFAVVADVTVTFMTMVVVVGALRLVVDVAIGTVVEGRVVVLAAVAVGLGGRSVEYMPPASRSISATAITGRLV